MDRFKPLDCTNSTLGAILFPDEEVITLQPSVGLYQGKDKVKDHQQGTLYLTSHRLIYVDDLDPHKTSCFLDLEKVNSSEYYAGFLKSSPKVTLGLNPAGSPDLASSTEVPSSSAPSSSGDWRVDSTPRDVGSTDAPASWICTVCGYSNAPTQGKCDLCGVRRDTTVSTNAGKPASNSLGNHFRMKADGQNPLSSTSSASQPTPIKGAGVACPTCTFSNHPSMVRCELCDSPLNTAAALMKQQSPRGSPSISSAGDNHSTPNLGVSPAASTYTPSRPATPGPPPESVKLSFRQGGDKAFYALIKSTLLTKAWKKRPLNSPAPQSSHFASNLDGRDSHLRRAGIDSILSSVDTGTRAQKDDMTGALKDLEALMAKAKQMVDLAESLNAKLSRQEAQSSSNSSTAASDAAEGSEAATLIRSSLVQLGLSAPAVTADMADSDSAYHMELAKELAGVLLGSGAGQAGLMGTGKLLKKGELPRGDVERSSAGRGLVGLDEAWCVWNRARGVALIPPKSLLRAAARLPTLTQPQIKLRTFRSGLSVLHTPWYDASRFGERLVGSLGLEEARARREARGDGESDDVDVHAVNRDVTDLISSNFPGATALTPTPPFGTGLTTLELSSIEQAPLILVQEMVEEAEMKGLVCRDEGPGGVRWFVNHFASAG